MRISLAPLRTRAVKGAVVGIVIALLATMLYVRVFERPLVTKSTHLDAAKDFSQDGNLVSEADDIFFGTVQQKVSQVSRISDLPETQFLVLVDKSLQGGASGNVVVNQLGGYKSGGLVLELVEDDPLLEPGHKYLLFTRDYETEAGKNGWRSLFFPGFTKLEVASPDTERALERRFGKHL